MATKRKYTVRHFRDGGAVPSDATMTADTPASTASPPPSPIPPPAPGAENALRDALERTRRAEEMARDPETARRLELERYVNSIPGLNEHKRACLIAHPELLIDPQRTAHWHKVALDEGVADDTEAMDKFLTDHIRFDIEAAQQRQAEGSRRIETPPEIPPPSPPPAPAMRPAMPSPPPSPRIPMSAPVSRDIPTPSGQRSPGSITLTAEQREVARASMAWLPPERAEREYAQNLARMRQLKAKGVIE